MSMIDTMHLSSEVTDITYLFPTDITKNTTVSEFKCFSLFKEYNLDIKHT